jgi:benzoylformate decarboxylase
MKPYAPVLLSIPQNVLEQQFDFEYRANTTVYSRLRPDRTALQLALKIVRKAKRPCLLVGRGVTRCAALGEVVRFAELTGVRVYQPWMSDLDFPPSHPQYLGDIDPSSPSAKDVLHHTDVLVAIGCHLFAQGFLNPTPILPKDLRIVHIDENSWEIGKNLPTDCGIHAHIRAALAELNDMLGKELSSKEREAVNKRVREIAGEKEKLNDQLNVQVEHERDRVPISISRLMTEIRDALPRVACLFHAHTRWRLRHTMSTPIHSVNHFYLESCMSVKNDGVTYSRRYYG